MYSNTAVMLKERRDKW